MIRPYQGLEVWRRAHRLNLDVSTVTRTFPREERFELTSQLRRAVRSVPTNLVEGHDQFGPRPFLRHVRIALGSLAEVDYLLLNAKDEGYLEEQRWVELADRVWALRGLLLKLAKSLELRASKAQGLTGS